MNALLDHPTGGQSASWDRVRPRDTSMAGRRRTVNERSVRGEQKIRRGIARCGYFIKLRDHCGQRFRLRRQRCLAASWAITVGEAGKTFTEAIHEKVAGRVTGYGLDDGVQMGPVISPESRSRIEGLIDKAAGKEAAWWWTDTTPRSPISRRVRSEANLAAGASCGKRGNAHGDLRPGACVASRGDD